MSTVDEQLREVKRLLRDRNFDDGIALLESMLAADPDSSNMVQNLGTACFAAGRLEDAIGHFEHLVRLKPNDATAFVNLGAVLNRAGEFRKASETLRKGLQRDRKCAPAYYNLGIAFRGEANNAMAVSSYKEALRLDADMVDAHFNLANVYVEMNNHQQAILHYKEALARRPGFTKAERGLAKAEAALAESRKSFSPFGRLVETKLPEPTKPATATGQNSGVTLELTEEQRVEDRNTVHDIAANIRTLQDGLRTLVHEELEPAISALNKVVSQGSAGSHLLSEAHEDFQRVLEEVRRSRRELQRAADKLREHEQRVRSQAAS